MVKLSKLKKIDLRKAWENEALDFTNWLVEEENLAILSEEIDVGIKVIETEASVGRYNVDILAEEEITGRKIIIENQLENTNHDHLGKIITYASGHDAEIVIWLVKNVRDEHKQAIDWLNEHTDEKLNFFAIKMELWQIGNSDFAPKFEVISKPNSWAKAIKTSQRKGGYSDTQLMQLEFWNKLKEYCKEKGSKLRFRKAHPQHWLDLSYGSSESHIALTINSQTNQIGTEIYIPDSKDLYYKFECNKDKIEKELDMKLEWMQLEGKKASRIKATKENFIITDYNRDYHLEWLMVTSEKFSKVFGKYKD